ncbi:hypothetical protein C493_14793 [Natronolimnohabitans innermongolicus JCM 12255]|uniref:DUF8009 domain-containing protein n=2 Tax=Natronolimnohabitans innermongolicus TaxID=253107 RepID=L9WV56_9EURY|nr:hypothetical protein C493_14793 [Natronolimnohabitans innermongolicus JCM 12255]
MRDDPTTDEQLADHPAAEIETVVVDPDDVVDALERTHESSTPLRTHVLRLVPPFEEEVRAEPHVQEGPRRNSPEREPEPIHLEPATFVRNETGVHPDETHLRHPTREQARTVARDEHGDDVDHAVVTTYYEDACEEWERRVRESLLERVRIYFEHRDGDEIWTDIRYESVGD